MVCPPPWWCHVQGSCVVSCFCSGHLRNGSWFVALLYPIANNCPTAQHAVIFSHSFFVFYCSRRLCPGAGTLAEDPGFQPVSILVSVPTSIRTQAAWL